jgi:hypothetical protein
LCLTVEWPSGEAAACKAVYVGSNPISTSWCAVPGSMQCPGAIGAAVARFPDTEEVTGSIPVSPTMFVQVSGRIGAIRGGLPTLAYPNEYPNAVERGRRRTPVSALFRRRWSCRPAASWQVSAVRPEATERE